MNSKIYNIFAKIYLYLDEFPVNNLIIKIGNYNLDSIYNKYKNDDIEEVDRIVDNIIINKKNDDSSLKFLLEIIFFIDYFHQSKQAEKLLNKDYLNTMYRDKIQLSSKFNNNINRLSGAYTELSSYLKSIIPIIKTSRISYNINNYYLENNFNKLKIALISGNLLEDESKKILFLNSVKRALEEKHNIILCSEYTGSKELDDEIYEISCQFPSTLIIFCPSYKNDYNENSTTIFFNEFNQIDTINYKKHYPYTEKGELKEDISCDDANFKLFHIKNFGIISLVICKDFFSPQVNDIINKAQIDLLLIMSKTDKYSDFVLKFESYCGNKRTMVLCNNCENVKKRNLNSPFLITYYCKNNDAQKKCKTENLPINCFYECHKFNVCYSSLSLCLENGLIKLLSHKHILEV